MRLPLWIITIVLSLELLIIITLIPSTWTEQVIYKETELLQSRMGYEQAKWVHTTARRWFDKTLIDNGLYDEIHRFLVPSAEERAKSKGLEDLGLFWFDYVDNRLRSLANSIYHLYSRVALMWSWLPYFLVVLIPALYDGYCTWRIKRTNFSYSSPVVHQFSTIGMFWALVLLFCVFVLPIVLEPMIIPAVIMMLCIMAGLAIGNTSKRI